MHLHKAQPAFTLCTLFSTFFFGRHFFSSTFVSMGGKPVESVGGPQAGWLALLPRMPPDGSRDWRFCTTFQRIVLQAVYLWQKYAPPTLENTQLHFKYGIEIMIILQKLHKAQTSM